MDGSTASRTVVPWEGPTLDQTRPDAVLVDLDGTLLDTAPLWSSAAGSLVRSHGLIWLPVDDEAVRGWPLPALCAQVLARGVTLPEQEVATRLQVSVATALHRGLPWRPGARSLLVALRRAGVPCALVATASSAVLDEVHEEIPAGVFTVVVGAGDEAGDLPSPALHVRAAGRLGVAPARCAALEDSAVGCRAALDAGALTYAVDPTVALPDDVAVHPRLRRVDGLAGVGHALLAASGW